MALFPLHWVIAPAVLASLAVHAVETSKKAISSVTEHVKKHSQGTPRAELHSRRGEAGNALQLMRKEPVASLLARAAQDHDAHALASESRRLNALLQKIASRSGDDNVKSFLTMLELCVPCRNLERFGEHQDGGYVMCTDELRGGLQAAYSYGINGFDGWGMAIAERYQVPLREYDCTNPKQPKVCPGCTVNFHLECVSGNPEEATSEKQLRLLQQVQQVNGEANSEPMVGARNSNECPAGSAQIESESECHSAADILGKTYHNAGSWAGSPKGCLLSEWDGRGVFYNLQGLGSSHIDQAPICKAPANRSYKTLTKQLQESGDGDAPEGSLLLKIDTEGAEWEVFANEPVSTLNKFRQIVVELHWLGKTTKYPLYLKALQKLQQAGFAVAHLHGNNLGLWAYLEHYQFPDVLEVTYVREPPQTTCTKRLPYHVAQDVPNNPGLPELPEATLPDSVNLVSEDEHPGPSHTIYKQFPKIPAVKAQACAARGSWFWMIIGTISVCCSQRWHM
mmetsp:Transcript_128839/g.223432  ORF Transcript_128839/g.223432 Transcript_128839/m.223432 type:complete len:509 (+) Transcript_128839:72-1598(+)